MTRLAILAFALVGATFSAKAGLNITLSAPSTSSSIIDLSIKGNFEPSANTLSSNIRWTGLTDSAFLAPLEDVFFLDSPIGISNPSGSDFAFGRIGIAYPQGTQTSQFVLFFDSNPGLLAGLNYRVSGASTFDISSDNATFASMIPGVYQLGSHPWSVGTNTLTIELQSIPEPAAGIFAAIVVFGFIIIRRRMRASSE